MTTAAFDSHSVFTPKNLQQQSPLFSVLPGEIRNEIFALALVQYEDNEAAYPKDSYWYRPGFSGPRRSSSALLRTCKLAYAEGLKVSLRGLEWAFWFNRGPDGRTGNSACVRFFGNLTDQQAEDLQKVRFFTQMYWLESGQNLRLLFRQPKFQPHTLTITIRYSDWWFWEDNEPLRMEENWLRTFNGPKGLRELRVEYEQLNWKKDEMMKIVMRNKKWKLAVDATNETDENGVQEMEGYLSADGTELEEWGWKGTSKLGGETWSHHGSGDMVEYVVITDTWRFVKGPMSKEDAEARGVHRYYPYDGDNGYYDYDDDEEEEGTDHGDDSESEEDESDGSDAGSTDEEGGVDQQGGDDGIYPERS